ncbi:MAG: class A beta-lactamase [Alphaproteobacteria bacterium]
MRAFWTSPSRRSLFALAGATALAGPVPARATPRDVTRPKDVAALEDLAALEARPGITRVGVAAMDLASGARLAHRADERFAMCSSFKWVLAALVLQRVDRGEESLERRVPFAPGDLVTYSPATEKAVESGGMGVADLCAAAVRLSDNTAANLLLATLGGPAGFTDGVRAAGDTVTRLDRWELDLNTFVPGDPRDTSSPDAMLGLMRRFLFGAALSPASRDRLRGWMIGARTGLRRLRAGLPADWIVGDKTGTNTTNSSNDVAFVLPSGNEASAAGPLLIVSFLNAHEPLAPDTDAVHAAVAREVIRVLRA